MLILFVLLALQVLPAKWVNPWCFVLIRYMALLFVPIGVGVMQYYDVLKAQFGPIVVSCAISTLVVFRSSAGVHTLCMANVRSSGRKQK